MLSIVHGGHSQDMSQAARGEALFSGVSIVPDEHKARASVRGEGLTRYRAEPEKPVEFLVSSFGNALIRCMAWATWRNADTPDRTGPPACPEHLSLGLDVPQTSADLIFSNNMKLTRCVSLLSRYGVASPNKKRDPSHIQHVKAKRFTRLTALSKRIHFPEGTIVTTRT